MNRIDLVNAINDYSFNGNEAKIIDILNDLFDSGEYKNHLNLIFNAISTTQMYGFLSYLTDDEQAFFIKLDKLRSNTYGGQRIDFYNSGQLSLLFEFEKYKKIFLSAPTSFGKTSLVIEYILSNRDRLDNILFIVPTNSLLEELYTKIMEINKRFDLKYSVSTQPYFYEGKNNFLIITPERFLLLFEDIDISNFDLIIMDETYKIVDFRNQFISDFIDSRALRFRKVADIIGNTSNQLILLSPFTYMLTNSMSEYLATHQIKKIDRKIEYVKREIIKIDDSISYRERFNNKIVGYTKDACIARKVVFLLNALEKEKNIVYVSQYSKAYEIIDELNWTRNIKTNDRYLKFLNHLERNYSIDDKCEWKIISALKKGIGIYISPLPRYIKREIVNLYDANVLGTLIVTTAFTEGVNTNASNLIFTNLINGPNTNKLSDIDILNVTGRAGRFAKKSIGKIYCITKDVYEKVNALQYDAQIKLENYNYQISYSHKRIDYELDMMDEKYLTDEEKEGKNSTKNQVQSLGLNMHDLHLSLNVSTQWKIILYKYFSTNLDKLDEAYAASVDLLSSQPNKRIDSLNKIFSVLKESFNNAGINGFPCQPYDIRAFDSKGEFVWGRLYKVYCSGSISNIISNNIKYISKQYTRIIKEYNLENCNTKEEVSYYFEAENMKWILRYYKKDLSLDFDAFYSETFKFISSIIQYKIPFYTSYFVSILKLFLTKTGKDKKMDVSKLDTKKITLLFEDGSIYDDYSQMIDYGISNDLIIKLHKNQITVEKLRHNDFSKDIFDEYECLLLDEFLEFNK